jgi:hypothetical protein
MKIKHILISFLIIAAATSFCTPIQHPSYFWHLTIGRWILYSKVLPASDYWSVVGNGAAWVRWISEFYVFECLIAFIDSSWGERGIAAIILVLTILLFVVVSISFARRAGNLFIGVFFALFAASGVLFNLAFGPGILGFTFFVLFLELVFSRESFKTERGFISSAFLLSILYVNIHPSFYISAVLALTILYLRSTSFLKHCLPFALISIISVFLTPYFGRDLIIKASQFFSMLRTQVLDGYSIFTSYGYAQGFLTLLVILFLAFASKHFTQLRKLEYFIILIAIGLASITKMFLPYVIILLGFYISDIWGKAEGKGFSNIGDGLIKLQRRANRFVQIVRPLAVVWVLLCVIIVNVYGLYQLPFNRAILPMQEADYINRNESLFPILHSKMIAPYLVYHFADEHGVPRHKVLFDHRVQFLRPEIDLLANSAFLKGDFLALEALVEEFKPMSILCNNFEPLCNKLITNSEWEVVFRAGREVEEGMHDMAELPYFHWTVFRTKGSK